MHKLAEKIADCLEAKIEGMGIDNIQGTDLEEFGKWTDIIKDIACYDKDMRIIKAMDEAEEEDDGERRYYRGQPRSKTSGRFMRRGDGRRGYEEMMPEEDWDVIQRMRDMDRTSMDRMYYSDSGMSGGYSSSSGMGGQSYSGNSGGQRGYSEGRDYREGRSGQSRRGYMEAKEMHGDNSPESKRMKMQELEKYMHELGDDITEMLNNSSPEEKNLLKQKMQTLLTKIN